MRINHTEAENYFAAYDNGAAVSKDGIVWAGAIDNCDVCSRPMGAEVYMIDGPAQTSSRPMWGNLCVTCAHKLSPIIGWGKAQLYKRLGSQWHLIAGGPPASDDEAGF